MKHCRYKGFTLLEALIAVLVLSLGLLGVAAMQLKAVQSAHVAYQRSVATLAAQDAVERLWVALGRGDGSCPLANEINSIDDLADWHDTWSVYLGGLASSPVNPDGSDPCKYTITVSWNDARFSNEDVSTLVYIVRLPGVSS
jgi:type IV pilus assembly protein PilV